MCIAIVGPSKLREKVNHVLEGAELAELRFTNSQDSNLKKIVLL